MQKYELLLILPGTLDDKEVDARSQEVALIVKEQSENIDLQVMGKNRLAYPIKQIRYGYYYTITFVTDAKRLKVLQDKLGLMRDVLRAIISHYNTGITAQQKIAYSTDTSGMTTMVEKPAFAPAVPTSAPVFAPVAAPEKKVEVMSTVARKIDKLDLDQINKKLDDLMSGDVITGV